jgi:tRNA1(Val) A37 N6-methylase TrmN6
MTDTPRESPLPDPAETTRDRLMGGRIELYQPVKGYRAGMDAALLAAACPLVPGERALEAGCGAGAALFQTAARSPGAHLVGVERDLDALVLAERNIVLNGMADRVRVRAGDVGRGFSGQGFLEKDEPTFDLAFANPPYFDDPDAIRGPDPSRRGAWIADTGLPTWTRFLLKAVREGGRIVMIHRAERLLDILALLAGQAGSFQVRPVHPHADEPAKRVLVLAIKTGKAPLRILPPLVLHDRGTGKHTPEADAVMRGEAALPWL